MNEQNYQNEQIIEYLLGSLPETEAERFDELSLTDDDFAGALDKAENELIDAYARGELSASKLERFKSHYLASPLRREKTSFAEAFQIYGERQTAEKIVDQTFDEKTSEARSGWLALLTNLFKNPLPRLGLACAALLVLTAGVFWIVNDRTGSETVKRNAPSNASPELPKQMPSAVSNNEIAAVNSPSESPRLPANAPPQKNANSQINSAPKPEKTIQPPKISVAFILAPPVRGGNQVQSLSIPAGTTDVKMKLELETGDFPAYQVALTDESGSVELWRSGTVKTSKGENKYLNVQFPAKLLKSKIYTLVVSGIGANGEKEITGNYPFRSVLK